MKKDSKQRLFEVMGRLDNTFKPSLNENFEEIQGTDDVDLPVDTGEEAPVEEKTVEQKYEELKLKVAELNAIIDGGSGEEEGEEVVDLSVEPEGDGSEEPPVEVDVENLQEWNFDKKKGEKDDSKSDDEKKDDDSEDKEKDLDEGEEPPKKVPVEAIAKVKK